MNSHPRTSQCKDNRSSASGRLTSSILQRDPGGDSRPSLSSRAQLGAFLSLSMKFDSREASGL